MYVEYTLPADFAYEPVTLKVTPAEGETKEAVCSFTAADISIDSLTAILDESGKTHLTAVVANRGNAPISSSYTVTFYKEADDGSRGEEIGKKSGSNLSAGQTDCMTMDATGLAEDTMIYAEVTSALSEENLYGNNSALTLVLLPQEDTIGLTVWLSDDSGRVVEISDPFSQLETCEKVFAASYDNEGKLISVADGTISGNTAVFQKSLSGAKWQFFFMDNNYKPLCEKLELTSN